MSGSHNRKREKKGGQFTEGGGRVPANPSSVPPSSSVERVHKTADAMLHPTLELDEECVASYIVNDHSVSVYAQEIDEGSVNGSTVYDVWLEDGVSFHQLTADDPLDEPPNEEVLKGLVERWEKGYNNSFDCLVEHANESDAETVWDDEIKLWRSSGEGSSVGSAKLYVELRDQLRGPQTVAAASKLPPDDTLAVVISNPDTGETAMFTGLGWGADDDEGQETFANMLTDLDFFYSKREALESLRSWEPGEVDWELRRSHRPG